MEVGRDLVGAHIVYPSDSEYRAPGAIGFHLARYLSRAGLEVRTHDWAAATALEPRDDWLLIGHPHPRPLTTFRRNVGKRGWAQTLALMPMNGDLMQRAFASKALSEADKILALAGPEWQAYLEIDPQYQMYVHKTHFLDMAAAPEFFPLLPNRDCPPHRRGVLYVGHSHHPKASPTLRAIRHQFPDRRFAWLGSGPPLEGFEHPEFGDLTSSSARAFMSNFHVIVNVSSADANPTTLLEGMFLGLLPVSTRHSGWSELQGIIHANDRSVAALTASIRMALDMPRETLEKRIHDNRDRALRQFTWEEFGRRVWEIISQPIQEPLADLGRSDARRLRAIESFAAGISRVNPVRLSVARWVSLARSRWINESGRISTGSVTGRTRGHTADPDPRRRSFS